MHRIIKCVMVFFISVSFLTGCVHHSFWDSDQKVSDDILEKIIEGINNKDEDAIKELFSEYAIENSESFDADVQSMFDFIDGNIVSYEESSPAGSFESSDRNYKIKKISSYYYVSTATDKYFFQIDNYSKNTLEPEKQGVKCLIIVKAEDRLKVYDGNEKILFDGEEEIDRYGVYIPDIY